MRASSAAAVLAAAVASAGCGGDEAVRGDGGTAAYDGDSESYPLFADLQWQVQCRVAGGCAGIPPRSINNLDGEDGHRLSCSVVLEPGYQRLSFSAYSGTAYGVEVRDAMFPLGGGPVVATGVVIVEEGGNALEGAFGADPPSPAQPCRLFNLRISEEADGWTIFADLLCVGLAVRTAPSLVREVTFPGASYDESTATTAEPAKIRIVNCGGL